MNILYPDVFTAKKTTVLVKQREIESNNSIKLPK